MSDNTPTPPPTERPNDRTTERPKTTGWEKADKAAHVTGKIFTGTALVMMKGYGVVLVILGIILLAVAFSGAWWAGFLIIGYGVYLLFPGSKWVVWQSVGPIIGVIIVFGVIFGVIAIRNYIGKRADADRQAREDAHRRTDG